MELQGRIVRVLGEQSGTNQQGKPWKKIEYLFGYYENPSDIYERNIVLSFMNERADQNAGYKENDKVKVRVALTCREYPQGSGRYFNDIRNGDLMMIQRADGGTQQTSAQMTGAVGQQLEQIATDQLQPKEGGKADDLPF